MKVVVVVYGVLERFLRVQYRYQGATVRLFHGSVITLANGVISLVTVLNLVVNEMVIET